MSKIEQMIAELCPNGVEYKKLVNVANIQYGFPFDSKLFTEDSSYIPLIRIRDVKSGKASTYYKGVSSDLFIVKRNDILVGMDGNFNLERWNDRDGLLNQRVCKIFTQNKSIILNNYLYHLLSPIFKEIEDGIKGGTVKHLSVATINKIEIPVPPLEIQQEIVRILDSFTNLKAELQTELQARKEQYEYYRNRLLTFDKDDNNVRWLSLGEIAEIGTGSSNTKDELEEGKYPFFVRSQLVRWQNKYEFDETAIITSGDGVGVGKIFHYIEGKYALHQRAYRIHILNNDVLPKYYFHYMKTTFYKYISSSAYSSSVTSVRRPMLLNYPVPIPPLEEQERIVSILDKFEALVNDLNNGLPAEIEAVQQQYEYYRNKLLTFKRKE